MRLSIGSVVVVLVAQKGSVWCASFLWEILFDEGGWRFSAKPKARTCRPQKHGITFAAGTIMDDRKDTYLNPIVG
jgi:hypothetical protein